MRDAAYTRGGESIVSPVTFDVGPGERVARICSTPQEAQTLALMAAALARPTTGSVLIGEFDSRVQPAHCKRIAGFVPHDPLPLAEMSVEHFIDYRAALWNIELERARAHARLILERLGGLHEAFAYPIVAALLAFPTLLVLDRPQPHVAQQILAAAGPCAIFSTHVDPPAALEYATGREEALA
jgi:ABC-type multidrug transport system ATPase subunit